MAPIFDGKLPQFFTLVGAPSKQNIGLKLPGTFVWEQSIDCPCVKSNNLEDIYRGYIASATLVCFSNSNSKHSWKRVSQFPDSNENEKIRKSKIKLFWRKKTTHNLKITAPRSKITFPTQSWRGRKSLYRFYLPVKWILAAMEHNAEGNSHRLFPKFATKQYSPWKIKYFLKRLKTISCSLNK